MNKKSRNERKFNSASNIIMNINKAFKTLFCDVAKMSNFSTELLIKYLKNIWFQERGSQGFKRTAHV